MTEVINFSYCKADVAYARHSGFQNFQVGLELFGYVDQMRISSNKVDCVVCWQVYKSVCAVGHSRYLNLYLNVGGAAKGLLSFSFLMNHHVGWRSRAAAALSRTSPSDLDLDSLPATKQYFEGEKVDGKSEYRRVFNRDQSLFDL